jgi:quercetin dioxygenase-like cupin family protein
MVTEGEVTLMLDIGETVVRAGDMVVQRNTNHAWRVLGDQPVKLWGIMVSLV